MVALGITYDNLPVTKAITADKVIPDGQARGQLAPVDLQGKIDEARQSEFMKFIQATYEIESLKKQANHARMVSLQSPLALP
ncbi:hypothetical protein ABTQ05_21490, partial [Acinetobacter baumannii]